MTVGMYSIKDTVGDEFAPIFFAKNDEQAIRQYDREIARAVALDKQNEAQNGGLFFSPEEFNLYFLGSFELSKGQFSVSDECPRLVK